MIVNPWLTDCSPLYFQKIKMSQMLVPSRTSVASRGRVYKCLRCTTIQPYLGERRRVVSHVYKDHIALVNCPYYCTVCLFRSVDAMSMRRHTTTYPPHQQKMRDLQQRGSMISDATAMRQSTDPYHLQEGVDLQRLDGLSSEDLWKARTKLCAVEPGIPFMTDAAVYAENNAWKGRSGTTLENAGIPVMYTPPSTAVIHTVPKAAQTMDDEDVYDLIMGSSSYNAATERITPLTRTRVSPYVPAGEKASAVLYQPTVISAGLDTPSSAPGHPLGFLDLLCCPGEAPTTGLTDGDRRVVAAGVASRARSTVDTSLSAQNITTIVTCVPTTTTSASPAYTRVAVSTTRDCIPTPVATRIVTCIPTITTSVSSVYPRVTATTIGDRPINPIVTTNVATHPPPAATVSPASANAGDQPMVAAALHQMTNQLGAAMDRQTAAVNMLAQSMKGFVRRTEDLLVARRSPAKRPRVTSPMAKSPAKKVKSTVLIPKKKN